MGEGIQAVPGQNLADSSDVFLGPAQGKVQAQILPGRPSIVAIGEVLAIRICEANGIGSRRHFTDKTHAPICGFTDSEDKQRASRAVTLWIQRFVATNPVIGAGAVYGNSESCLWE